ncbi:MAG: Gfo/Idh/MocA family oxidoreductase [Planctomycetota bacterium]|nr:Gfo/Idh/MocA family oxidoreductase [Planctomycetota bacterium]
MGGVNVLRFGVAGIGGYAGAYVRSLEAMEKEGIARMAAAVVRTPSKYPKEVEALRVRGVRIYPSLEAMLDEAGKELDAVGLPTGIQDHMPQTVAALRAGLHVVVEKPPAAVVQDVRAMIEARDRSGRQVAVGFQSQSGPLMKDLKKLILDGRLGKITELAAFGPWARHRNYYARNRWAGKIMADGRWALDGPMMNALAHYLMDLLYLAGPDMYSAARVEEVTAECCHARAIETEDLTTLRARAADGVSIYFAGTHCWTSNKPVRIEITGEKGTVVCNPASGAEVRYANGETETLKESGNDVLEMFRNAAAVFSGRERHINCPLEMAIAHTITANCAYLSSGGFHAVPPDQVYEETDAKGEVWTRIRGIEDWLGRAFRERKLLSEVGIPWAVPGRPYRASDLHEFRLP